mgnify:CR=1 FL=1
MVLFLVSGQAAEAQIAYETKLLPGFNMDRDIYELRHTVMPGFHYIYDDITQYAPAAVLLGMKACGYESRSSWGRMLVSDAFSAAIMAGAVNGIKYSVGRLRPDGSRHNSFPSGHTATAFMTATMLHQEYGWRNPWFSIGGYTAAAITGVSRICNNRHWLSDVIAGAGIGIGAVHLGYYLTDLIFKDKHIYDGYEKPCFFYDAGQKHYVAEMVFGRRFIIGSTGLQDTGTQPVRGAMSGVSVDIPLAPGIGLTGRTSASSMTYAGEEVASLYSALAGGFYNLHFAKIMEFQAKAMIGYAWTPGIMPSATDTNQVGYGAGAGISLGAGASLSLITGNNFKIKAFAELESMDLDRTQPWLSTLVVGFGTGWFW